MGTRVVLLWYFFSFFTFVGSHWQTPLSGKQKEKERVSERKTENNWEKERVIKSVIDGHVTCTNFGQFSVCSFMFPLGSIDIRKHFRCRKIHWICFVEIRLERHCCVNLMSVVKFLQSFYIHLRCFLFFHWCFAHHFKINSIPKKYLPIKKKKLSKCIQITSVEHKL